MGRQAKPIEERFWTKVDKKDHDNCWLWLAAKNRKGYGYIKRKDGKHIKAHRLSYEIHHSKIPAGLFVCHNCDNPSCVNPNHLFLGTHQDNVTDMVNKGRNAKPQGERHAMCRLTKEDVLLIRGDSRSAKIIALDFSVLEAHVRAIWNGRWWKILKMTNYLIIL